MEGYAPAEDGAGCHLKRGHFVNICRDADNDPGQTYVLVIDELSRADVGRVFGEALTYVEKSKRGIPFSLPSGRTISVPKNLLLIMTMNPMDKGVDEVDAAFERRFAKVGLDPDANQLAQILETNGVETALTSRIVAWFRATNGRASEVPQAALGHAYFSSVVDEFTLRDVWAYQLRYHVERAFRYDPSTRDEVIAGWQRVFRDIPGGWDGTEEQSEPAGSGTPSGSGQ
jgi:5-methylcytosine-specific restriction protein B